MKGFGRVKLSIIIPVYNESKSIRTVIKRCINLQMPNNIKKEIIVIDDGSTDNTWHIVKQFENRIKSRRHTINSGKGEAIRTGISISTGDFVIIQDGDMELPPENIISIASRIRSTNEFIIGSRFLKKENFRLMSFSHFIGNFILSLVSSLIYQVKITDIMSGYKCIPINVFKRVELISRGFELRSIPKFTICIADKPTLQSSSL